MIIKKGEREYSVTELSHEWKAERVLGGVAVEYKIPKEAAPDAAAVERYIAENELLGGVIPCRRRKEKRIPRRRSNGDITRKHIRSFLRAFQRKRRRLSRRNVPPRVFRKRRLSKRR